MNIIGIDFGSRSTSVGLWQEGKNDVEIITDEYGFRFIPTCVAFREDEVLVGEAAYSQYHKNIINSFPDLRKLFIDDVGDKIFVPAIDKELSHIEIASHFFRHINNRVKHHSGKQIRDCIISVPESFSETAKDDLVESAKMGGIRIKSFISNNISALIAHELDDPACSVDNMAVLDIGWSSSKLSIWRISKGLLVSRCEMENSQISGKNITEHLVQYCCAEFQKKYRMDCRESKKSVEKLRKECEGVIKTLAINTEVNIDVDSLYEGIDFTIKISRARFDDISMDIFKSFRVMLKEGLSSAGVSADASLSVVLAGGLCALPRVKSIINDVFPQSTVIKSRFDGSEINCLGAVLHGRYLMENNLIDCPPSDSLVSSCLEHAIWIESDESSVSPSHKKIVISVGTLLPFKESWRSSSHHLRVSQITPVDTEDVSSSEQYSTTLLGELIVKESAFGDSNDSTLVAYDVSIDEEGHLTLKASRMAIGDESGKSCVELGALEIKHCNDSPDTAE